ncbi:succinate dehydrogenase subunit 3-1, mitochondrial-like isoform X1 [Cryptomeria japonica]|uniref:succinate dehydrogenase subunit 3-1, mitochondrial-like isoform X1 n=1 Tax=Cryptomeria japonica TaxID=3369 RepID=UPI0027DA726D|nr:succinate dehydrogenase subunit 3-1, mitochondrial-like isoform X1 [Cryptomeria japonica]
MALAGILRRSQTKHCTLGLAQVVAQRDGVLFGAFAFAQRWTTAARVFSSKGSGSDIVGMDLVNSKSHNGVTEGKVPQKSPNSHVWVETNEQQYLASRTGALLTGKMKGAAESYIRSVVNGAVTLPSYFSNMQRQAVNAVGRITGFSTASGPVEGTSTNGDASMQNVVDPKKNINRPLSPHLSIYEPQLTSTYSIFNRISGAFLTAVLLSGLLFVLEIGPLSLTYPSLYTYLHSQSIFQN